MIVVVVVVIITAGLLIGINIAVDIGSSSNSKTSSETSSKKTTSDLFYKNGEDDIDKFYSKNGKLKLRIPATLWITTPMDAGKPKI